MSRADIIAALFERMAGVAARVERNIALPAAVPSGGLVIMRDGDPGEPVVYLGRARPLEHWSHVVDVEIYVQAPDSEGEIYQIYAAIGSSLHADRSLSGLAEDVIMSGPVIEVVENDTGAAVMAALVQITLSYVLPRAA